MKLRTAPRRLQLLASRWLLPLPKRLPEAFEYPAPIRRPLVLISQAQRSGGTMLAQLLDGHPELLVFPGELHIGKPKSAWPTVNPGERPAIQFRRLVDHKWIERARLGFSKTHFGTERLPFRYDVDLHQSLFCAMFKEYRPVTSRQVLDLFNTSYFAVWQRETMRIEFQKTLYYVAHVARLASKETSVMNYFRDYPDGHLISIIRNPRNWFPSELKKRAKKGKSLDATATLKPWLQSAEAILRNMEKFPDQVTVIDFEDLILHTQGVIDRTAQKLGMTYEASMLTPTFDGRPIESNSSFRAVKGLIDSSVLSRSSNEDIPSMDHYMSLYEEIKSVCLKPVPAKGTEARTADSISSGDSPE